jgi:Domain of unknown function (DUF4440)
MPSITKLVFSLISTVVLMTGLAVAATDAPTPQNALAADDRISQALLANDTTTLRHLLASDWIVVSANGSWVGRDDILEAIKAGYWTHTQVTTSKPRVRIYGMTALVTERAVVSGMSRHKAYVNVRECQTDVLVWKDGRWVSELLHESFSKSASSNC